MGTGTKVLPVALLVEGRRCVVVGGGPVGTRKVHDLLAGGARVLVVAPEVTSELAQMASEVAEVTWRQGEFHPSDLDDVALVITATGVREVDTDVFEHARARGLFVNSADDPERCNFYLTALVRRDPVVVSVTTAGTSPALAAYLKRRLDTQLEDELGTLAELLGDVRRDLLARGVSTEKLPWASVVSDELVALAVQGRWDDVRRSIITVLGATS